MRDFWFWAMKNNLEFQMTLVKSAVDMAEGLSRTPLDKGDYTLQKNVSTFLPVLPPLGLPHRRHVCNSMNPSITTVHFQAPTLASYGSRLLKLPPGRYKSLLCKPPLENNNVMVREAPF